jgi:hypothetical protein
LVCPTDPFSNVPTDKTNQLTAVNVPGALSDAATGISNVSMICGFFTNAAGQAPGFVQPLSSVSLTTFAMPGSRVTQLVGVNNHGDVVGFYVGADTFPQGVIYNIATGQLTYIDAPTEPSVPCRTAPTTRDRSSASTRTELATRTAWWSPELCRGSVAALVGKV